MPCFHNRLTKPNAAMLQLRTKSQALHRKAGYVKYACARPDASEAPIAIHPSLPHPITPLEQPLLPV